MKTNKRNSINFAAMALLLIVGFALGFSTKTLMAPRFASPQVIETAKNEIANLYRDKAVDACWQVNNGSSLAAEKYELTYRNIRINKQANRAIVTDCSESSTLLAKKTSGEWMATNVNLVIGSRVNPVWQKLCLIEDITVADDTIRPENSTIDEMNLQECKELRDNSRS